MKLQKTITSIFIVPTLSISREKLADNGFVNGYIKDGMREIQYENAVYLLFKPENLDKFKDFLDEEYERTKSIIDDYDYEGGYIVVVYMLNSRLEEDFKLIKESKYSQTSKKFQEIFPKIVKINKLGYQRDEISLQYRIFNKTEDLRKYWEDILNMNIDETIEVWQGFFEDNETINLTKIKEHV
jgi:hypothetical protein